MLVSGGLLAIASSICRTPPTDALNLIYSTSLAADIDVGAELLARAAHGLVGAVRVGVVLVLARPGQGQRQQEEPQSHIACQGQQICPFKLVFDLSASSNKCC